MSTPTSRTLINEIKALRNDLENNTALLRVLFEMILRHEKSLSYNTHSIIEYHDLIDQLLVLLGWQGTALRQRRVTSGTVGNATASPYATAPP